jgi:hypothetical protein
MAGAGSVLACRGWGVHAYSSDARASKAAASSTWDNLEADKGRVRFR